MKVIKYIEGITGIEAGLYAGAIEGIHTFLTDASLADEKDTRVVLEIEATESEQKFAELQTLFPNAKFELIDTEQKDEQAKAGN